MKYGTLNFLAVSICNLNAVRSDRLTPDVRYFLDFYGYILDVHSNSEYMKSFGGMKLMRMKACAGDINDTRSTSKIHQICALTYGNE